MDTKDQNETRYTQNYKIDYNAVDVARIMDQIKAKAARQAAGTAPGEEAEACPAGPPVPPPSEPLTAKKKVKIKLLKFFRPFFPIQRIIALPVHEDLMKTNRDLWDTNQRIDHLVVQGNFSENYIKILHTLCHNLVVELTKLRVEHDALKSRVQILDKDFEFLGKREKVLEKKLV